MTNFESINISLMGFIAVEKLERFSTNDLYYGTTLFHTNLSNCYKTVETTLKTHILTSVISELEILVTSSLFFFVSGVNLVSQLRFLGLTKSHDKVVQGCVT